MSVVPSGTRVHLSDVQAHGPDAEHTGDLHVVLRTRLAQALTRRGFEVLVSGEAPAPTISVRLSVEYYHTDVALIRPTVEVVRNEILIWVEEIATPELRTATIADRLAEIIAERVAMDEEWTLRTDGDQQNKGDDQPRRE